MKTPDNGASMHDAANTREDEKPDLCCGCDRDPDTCGRSVKDCKQEADAEAAEERYEAMREL